jgi:WhiB family redox-sensing transcriptional regulator
MDPIERSDDVVALERQADAGDADAAERLRRVMDQLRPGEWVDDAACRHVDRDLFFPAKGDRETPGWLVRLCHKCPVEVQCLEYALAIGTRHGVWGGLTERERRRIARARRATGPPRDPRGARRPTGPPKGRPPATGADAGQG